MHLNQNIHFMTTRTSKAWGIIALSLCLQNTDFFVLPVIIAYAHVSGYLSNNLYLWTPLMGNAIIILGYLYIYQRYIWWYVILGKNCTCYPYGFIYEVPVIWYQTWMSFKGFEYQFRKLRCLQKNLPLQLSNPYPLAPLTNID